MTAIEEEARDSQILVPSGRICEDMIVVITTDIPRNSRALLNDDFVFVFFSAMKVLGAESTLENSTKYFGK